MMGRMQRETPRRDAIAMYFQPRMLAVLFMGFASGLPLPLTYGTLSFWLAEAGVSRTAIGLFALIGLSYNLKFVWSPIMDRARIPWLTARLGRRRSWALLTQLALVAAIASLALTDPKVDPRRRPAPRAATARCGTHRSRCPGWPRRTRRAVPALP